MIDAGAGAVLGTANERPAWLEHETAFEKTVKICVFVVVIAAVLYPFLSVLATSLVGTVLIGSLIALLGITLVLSLGWQSNASVPDWVMGFVMVPLFALMALQQEMFRSFRKIGLAYAPSLLLRPSLVILGAACVLAFGHQLDSSMALALTTTATVFVIGLQAWRLRRALGPIVLSARPVYERRIWIKAALPLLVTVRQRRT